MIQPTPTGQVPDDITPAEAIAEDAATPLSERERHRQEIHEILTWFVLPVVIVVIIRLFLFGFYVIPSGSMKNTIQPGDRVIGSMLTPKISGIKRGDIVVFKDPANWLTRETGSSQGRLIKRVIGLPGDHVVCEGSGQRITVNGTPIDESAYLPRNTMPSNMSFDITVTDGHLFVMGDNRDNSADSRFHQSDGDNGLVPITDVEATGLVTYWPIEHIGLLDGHHDAFANVPDPTTK